MRHDAVAASSSSSGMALRSTAGLLAMTMPYSASRPRVWLMIAVRCFIFIERMRCEANPYLIERQSGKSAETLEPVQNLGNS
jgi:hypothetical protein